MFKQFLNNKITRVITAVLLLSALFLSACGMPVPTPTTAPLEEVEQPEEVLVTPSPEPTPEPTPEPFRTDVVLNELQASNKATIPDSDGDFVDWIELYNPSEKASDLSGCWLSDDENDLCKWCIPSLTIESGAYQIIFCSGKDRAEGEFHTSFKLSSDGDMLYLSSPEGNLLWQVSYERCPADASLCFEEEAVRTTYYTTPGWPNTENGYEEFLSANDLHSALVVNEAATYNDDQMFHAGGFYDWIELKNISGETINLGDYYISDDTDNPFAFRLPDTSLAPNATFTVHCGEPLLSTSACHAPFKLDAKGDSVYICDYISLYGVPLNHSKGRLSGKSGHFLFSKQTPGAENGPGARMISARPQSVTPTGIYNNVDGIDVELSGEGTIYYTTNGNLPDTASYVYSGPIHLTRTTAIRAISVKDGKLKSETATFTYIINENHDLPVVCIALEPMKLDVLYNHNGHMEYDSHTEFYDVDGGTFASDCMVTLHGAASRSAWDKKSFKVVFRDRYGGDINYDLFGQGITEFHSLNLRGGDSVCMISFREPLSAEFAERVAVQDPFALDSRFCVLYVNGQYYGLYSLREAYSRKYVASHTGSDEDAVNISRAPIKIEYQPELFAFHNFIVSCNINDPDNYQYIADRLDMESMAQWLLLEAYFNNLDPTGNIRYVIGNQPDNKWRTMFFDLDISMTNNYCSMYAMVDQSSQIGRISTHLLRSSQFRQVLLETASGLWKNGLSYTLALEILDRMLEETSSELPRSMSRWGESQIMYQNNLAAQKAVFTQARDESWLRVVKDYAEVDDATMAAYFPER